MTSINLSEAAKFLGAPENQLLQWACFKIGPKYTGSPYRPSHMSYDKAEVEQWLINARQAVS